MLRSHFCFCRLNQCKFVKFFRFGSSLLLRLYNILSFFLLFYAHFEFLFLPSHCYLLFFMHGLNHILLIIIVSDLIELVRIIVSIVGIIDQSLRILADEVTLSKSLIVKRVDGSWLWVRKKGIVLSEWVCVSWVWLGNSLSMIGGWHDDSSLFVHNFSITTITVWQYES